MAKVTITNNVKAFAWIGAVVGGFYFIIHADYAKTAKASTVEYWIGGILLGVAVVSAVIGFASQGSSKRK